MISEVSIFKVLKDTTTASIEPIGIEFVECYKKILNQIHYTLREFNSMS